jgi:hypothetical protein
MRPEQGQGRREPRACGAFVFLARRIEAACSRQMGGAMEEHDLLEFAAGFGDVGPWYDAMRARGYSMPLQLCHGLSQAMKHLNLTFPQAFRLFWDNRKILVSGRSLIYDFSASKLWTAGSPPQEVSPGCPNPSDPSSQRDVLAQVPPTKEILHLEVLWRLDADSSPMELLLLWQPTDKVDQHLRLFLLDFGHRVLAAERAKPR